jgi:hypothetical protein
MKRTYGAKMIPKPLTFVNILLKLLYRIDYVLSYLILINRMNQKIFIGILSLPILTKMPSAISMRDL